MECKIIIKTIRKNFITDMCVYVCMHVRIYTYVCSGGIVAKALRY